MTGGVLLVHHAANRGHGHPPSSLSGVMRCLEAGARAIEIDVTPLADGEYALLHDARLDTQTDGQGPVARETAASLAGRRLRWRGRVTSEPVANLGQVVAAVRDSVDLVELQLDLKVPVSPGDAQLEGLLRAIEPVHDRVRVTSTADWALWPLHALDGRLALGFDPLQYLDAPRAGGYTEPPLHAGAYGYLDDHPLAAGAWGSPAAYLALRAAGLWRQAPPRCAWYIRGRTLAQALDDGFDWIAWLHERGAMLDAWTLDAESQGDVALARRLIAVGVDRITSNDPPALARALGGGCVY